MEPATSVDAYTQITLPLLEFPVATLMLLIILPSAAILGFLKGRARRRRQIASGQEVDMRTGETTIGAVLALLGLVIAFTFGNALSQSYMRKASVVKEAAALGTVFARADYLPEPGRTVLKQAILDYARTRVLADGPLISDLQSARAFLDRSLAAQVKLWPLTVQHAADPLPPAIQTFFASAMNDALDAHLSRMQNISVPVSEITQFMVLAAALAGLFLVGDRSGLLGRQLTWRTFVLSGFLFMVLVTITDTMRSSEGLIRLDEGPLRATIAEMEAALAA